ncbi:MAG: ABC transporter permease [Pseudomonadota bacterium]|nr:ABC transporter permease [Pseudomonadota bacterium]
MNNLSILKMSLRALRRDWQAGELRVLAAALVVAVASVAAVGFFTDRIRVAVERQAGELLAADLLIGSREPLDPQLRRQADDLGLQAAAVWTFPSVVLAGDLTALAEIKAVEAGYPLRGALEVSDRPFAPARRVQEIPAPGTAWADPRLMQELRLGVGDAVEVGASRLRVTQVLAHEPDRGGDLFSIAPRLLLNLADIPATQLVQPGSRVRYHLLLAGSIAAVDDYRQWAGPRLPPGARLQGVRDERPELKAALDRAQRFLGLAALVSVVLAGVAVAIAARRFAARHWDGVAIMRCVGASEALILRLYLGEMLWLALLAGAAGALLGYAAQEGLTWILRDLAGGGLPPPTGRPVLPALLMGLITLLGFGLPPLVRLKEVPPLRVLRRDLGPVDRRAVGLYLPALLAAAALLYWQAADPVLASYVFAGVLGTVLVLGAAAWGLVRSLDRLRGRAGVAWRFGLANIARRGPASTVQVVALGLGIMVLLALTLVRNDLLATWRDSLPPGAPNHFLINIPTDEVAGVQAFFGDHGLAESRFYPLVRGRLVAVNGRPVAAEDYEDPRARRMAERSYNLSWTDTLQDDNRVVAGRWWQPQDAGRPVLSMEQELAQRLGVNLNDRLRFDIGGQVLEAQVTSLRSVDWDSMRANFFVLFPPGVLDDFPATWITSFYLPPAQKPLLSDLVRAFPSVTVLDVEALLDKLRQIIDRVALAVQYVFLFTLLAGLMVLYAAIQATHDERLVESALLRTLGAQKGVILQSLLAEFAVLGLLAGLLAATAASVLGYALAEHLFGFPYRFNALIWLLGGGAGVLGVGAAGLLGTRAVLNRPPLRSLREV